MNKHETQADPAAEVERMMLILDQHLPTILYGLQEALETANTKSRDELTPTEVALRAAYSAAHWIAKDIATGGGEALYDLPSVLDLLKTRKDSDRRAKVMALMDAAEDYDTKTTGMKTDYVKTWLEQRARDIDHGRIS